MMLPSKILQVWGDYLLKLKYLFNGILVSGLMIMASCTIEEGLYMASSYFNLKIDKGWMKIEYGKITASNWRPIWLNVQCVGYIIL